MRGKSLVQQAALAVGATFLLVGILGFIPGITTDVGDISGAGHTSDAHLLGLFQVSVLHNIVHILFGIAGFALARTFSGARSYLVGGGAVYLLLAIYGVLVDKGSDANFVPLNGADDVLHLVLGLGMIAAGVVLSRNDRTRNRDRDYAHA